MNDLPSKYDISPREMARGRNLKMAAWLSPVVLPLLPLLITFVLFFLFAVSPPAAATILFLGLLITFIGFVTGLVFAGIFSYRYSNWKDATRERMAADGVKADEIDWFMRELRPAEKRALKDISASDVLLADAYRETLASRLTASRVIKSSKKDLLLAQRRQSKLRVLNSERAAAFQEETREDISKLTSINNDAKQMLIEAESRLQMIEAAAMRGSGIADSELALKKLSARSEELPLALEEARLTQSILKELEEEELAVDSTPKSQSS